jgi:hypothetical protein
MSDSPPSSRPGLAKARALPLVAARRTTQARAIDARWRELFDAADTVSEGCVRDERQGRVWYGSTSLILPLAEGTSDAERAFVAEVAARDVHVRLRAMRAAQREASLRAPARLGRLGCEIHVAADSRGVRIDVDVQAPLIGGRAGSRRPAR